MDTLQDVSVLLETPPPTLPPMERGGRWLPGDLIEEVDATVYDGVFTVSANLWMRGETGEGRRGIIGRNDALCRIYQYLASMDKFSRNKHENLTAFVTRPDRTDKFGGVPLVIVKEEDHSLIDAQDDIRRMLRWLPHFDKLPFIFGIAITHSELTIHTLHRAAPTVREVFATNLSDPHNRWRCIVAAINVARIIKGFVAEGVLFPSPLSFDVWHTRNDQKKIYLGMQFAEVEFASKEQYDRMRRFCMATTGIAHLEGKIVGEHAFDAITQRIKLWPVGVSRQPEDLVELVTCVKHISEALFHLHARQYMHCDVRWPNTIEYFGEWYLVDCEYACAMEEVQLRLDRVQRMRPSHVMDRSEAWTYRHDLYQVGLLLRDWSGLAVHSPVLCDLQATLLSKNFTVADVKAMVNRL